jgi:hypothetical protein
MTKSALPQTNVFFWPKKWLNQTFWTFSNIKKIYSENLCSPENWAFTVLHIVIGLMGADYIFSGFWKLTPHQIFKSRLSFHHNMHKKVNRYYIDQWMLNFLENTSFHYFSEVHVTCFQFSMFYAGLCLIFFEKIWIYQRVEQF